MNRLLPYSRLCRTTLSLFAACSAGTGSLLAPDASVSRALLPFSAVFLLACGASALNQYQEQDIDARMERTKGRPLPSGSMSSREALAVSLFLVAAGEVTLAFTGSIPVLLGLFALLWYNVVYTRLKRITAFAAVPGALAGVIPPAVGWAAAGGAVADRRLFIVSILFFLWQVPHFWLQVLHHGEEYEQAGLPSLTRVMTRRQIARVTFVWICSAASAGILLPLYGAVTSPLLYASLMPAVAWLVLQGAGLLRTQQPFVRARSAFRQLNVYIVFVMVILSAERIFAPLP